MLEECVAGRLNGEEDARICVQWTRLGFQNAECAFVGTCLLSELRSELLRGGLVLPLAVLFYI